MLASRVGRRLTEEPSDPNRLWSLQRSTERTSSSHTHTQFTMSPIFSPLSSFSSILLLLGVLISLEPFPLPSHRTGDTQLHLTYMRVAVAVVPVEKLRQYTIITVEYRFLLLFKTAGCPKSYRGNLPDDAFRGRNTQCKSQLTGDVVDRLGYWYGNTIVANSINLTLFLSAILCHC